MRCDPLEQLFARQITGRKSQDDLLSIVNVHGQLEAVHHKKRLHRRMPDPLVAIRERMIHDKRETQRGRFGLDGWIEFITAECHLRLSDGGLDTAQIAHAVRAARLFNDAPMKIENFAKR